MSDSSSFVRAVLVLPVRDMKQARTWYAHALDFETVYLHDDPVEDPKGNYAILRRDGAEVHLILDEPATPRPSVGDCRHRLSLPNRAGSRCGVPTGTSQACAVTRRIKQKSWGARAFQLTDPSGNWILVAEVTQS